MLAQPSDTISLEGRVVNGTSGGEIPVNLPVTLHVVDGDAGSVATFQDTADEPGRFVFADVPVQDSASYVLVADYAGMRYNELLEPAQLNRPAELTVYEVTRDIAVINVERQAMLITDINEADREIHVLEVLSINNTSDTTLLPELTNITNPAAINFLRFSLPTGAGELDVQSNLAGGDIIPIGTGFAITAPVLPGAHQIAYTYKFPYAGDSVTFNQRLIQGALLYQILAPTALAQIQITPLEVRPRIDLEGTTYLVWEARDVPPRQGITLQFANLPQPGLTARIGQAALSAELWLTAIPVLLAASLGVLLLYAWFRGQREVAVGDAATADSERRQTLVQTIAVLDESFARGEIPEKEYRANREALLRQLRRRASSADTGEPAQ